ncbi:MAG: OmpA family protein [Deltaproteobacteria bacterium]|nr:OmpA family protein [Deltaproteobacteria bacterium]
MATVACASAQVTAPSDDPRSASSEPGDAQRPKAGSDSESVEIVKGELREAVLALRRVHFAKDTATILPEARAALNEAGEKLLKFSDVEVTVDGHADARGTTEYNVALAQRRAETAAAYLEKLGIPRSRLSVVSFGMARPLEDGPTARALAKNRRIEFRLSRGRVRLVLEDGVTFDDRGRVIAEN